jgi:hypothetical protein
MRGGIRNDVLSSIIPRGRRPSSITPSKCGAVKIVTNHLSSLFRKQHLIIMTMSIESSTMNLVMPGHRSKKAGIDCIDAAALRIHHEQLLFFDEQTCTTSKKSCSHCDDDDDENLKKIRHHHNATTTTFKYPLDEFATPVVYSARDFYRSKVKVTTLRHYFDRTWRRTFIGVILYYVVLWELSSFLSSNSSFQVLSFIPTHQRLSKTKTHSQSTGRRHYYFVITPPPKSTSMSTRLLGSAASQQQPRRRRQGDVDNSSDFSFVSALAIVPNVKDWDRLQRARHYARDPAFHQWPPAIRLFHPFFFRDYSSSSSAAFDVAQVVEDLELEPFEITMANWVIIPNIEAMQTELEMVQAQPDTITGITESASEAQTRLEMLEAQQLVEQESIKSTKKNRKRKHNTILDEEEEQEEDDGRQRRGPYNKARTSALDVMKEQQKMLDDDGGPCILCLEPDDESRQKLMELREALQEGLDLDSYFSPSSLYSWKKVKNIDVSFRPLIPISKFDSFQVALDVARRLKGLWGKPLTFQVKDLHLLSCGDPDDDGVPLSAVGMHHHHQSAMDLLDQAWGCNARVMLLGEEVQQDEKANQEMVNRLVEEGEPGGMDISFDYTILDDEDESVSDIEKWLNEDEDFDEGTEVIIGRTHFFTGDQRTYKGMPATSTVDTKDRALGNFGSVSGASRRRGTASRQTIVWQDGEYGRKERDYSPWTTQERASKEKFSSWPTEDGDTDIW